MFLKHYSLCCNTEFGSSSCVLGLLHFEWNVNQIFIDRILNGYVGVLRFVVWSNKCVWVQWSFSYSSGWTVMHFLYLINHNCSLRFSTQYTWTGQRLVCTPCKNIKYEGGYKPFRNSVDAFTTIILIQVTMRDDRLLHFIPNFFIKIALIYVNTYTLSHAQIHHSVGMMPTMTAISNMPYF